MDIFFNPEQFPKLANGTCVTWGNFDGVHLGHQKLLGHVVRKARSEGLTSVVVTFNPHPLQILGTPPRLITSMPTRLELLAAQGLDIALVLPFTKTLAELEPEDFVHKVLVGPLNTRQMIMGYSSFFGKGRRGSATLLAAMGQELGFAVEQLSPALLSGAVVSSTRVRRLIGEGAMREVTPLLGRMHFVDGHVVRGRQLGRKLGFPTLNVHPGKRLTPNYPNCNLSNLSGLPDTPERKEENPDACAGMLPCPGVYAALVEISENRLRAVASIGTNPTFELTHGPLSNRLEVHILDFNQDVYDHDVRVHFADFLRPTIKFDSPEQLVSQIKLDVEKTKKIV